MKRSLAPVAALLLSTSVLLTGQGLQGTLLPVRATLENFTTLAIGTMGAAFDLSAGSTSASTSSMPACRATARAVRAWSPVTIATR